MKWIQTLRLFILLLFLCSSVAAQFNGNNWIDFTSEYYKVEVSEDGIYRIPYEVLLESGIQPTGDFLELYNNGKQIPIYVTNNLELEPGDYVEFYGEKNKGNFDRNLYDNPIYKLDNEVSLFSDVNTYFLTSNSTNLTTKLRYEDVTQENAPGFGINSNFYIHQERMTYLDEFNKGEPVRTFNSVEPKFLPDFASGEGFISGNTISSNTLHASEIEMSHQCYSCTSYPPQLKIQVVGLSDAIVANYIDQFNVDDVQYTDIDHQLQFHLGNNILGEMALNDYEVGNYSVNLSMNAVVNGANQIMITGQDGISNGIDFETNVGVSMIELKYPRYFKFNNATSWDFTMNIEETKRFNIDEFDGGEVAIMYDFADQKRWRVNREITPFNDEIFKIEIHPNESAEREFVIFNESDASVVNTITSMSKEMEFTEFDDPLFQGDYIILTHQSLMEGENSNDNPIEDYKTYRSSQEGGSYQVQIVDIEQLYDQFSFGIPNHPLAIRNFIDFAMNNWDVTPKYLNIIGNGVSYDIARYDEDIQAQNLIPTFGMCGSDYLLTAGAENYKVPQLAVGRIPATTTNEVFAYLNKIKKHEEDIKSGCIEEERKWRKEVLNIAKGYGQEEVNDYAEELKSLNELLESGKVGNHVLATLKDDCVNCFDESDELKDIIESGVSLINFMGLEEDNDNYWKFDMHSPNDFSNAGKYPFIISNTSKAGNLFDSPDNGSMAKDFVLANNRGAIGYLGMSSVLPDPRYCTMYSERFIEKLTDEMYGATIGEIILTLITEFEAANEIELRELSSLFSFTGDPALKLYDWEMPEFVIDESTFHSNTDIIEPGVESINLKFELNNWGKFTTDEVTIKIVRIIGDEEIELINDVISCPAFSTVLNYDVSTLPYRPDQYNFKIMIDPENEIDETCENNELLIKSISGATCNNCVWPGDTDNDGIANNFDVFNIGYALDYEGSERENSNIAWLPNEAENWGHQFKEGLNYKFSDSNGDGMVNESDVDAIHANYNHTSISKGEDVNGDQFPISIVFESNEYQDGDVVVASVMLGSFDNPPIDVFGVAFTADMSADEDLYQEDSFDVNMNGFWLGADDAIINFIEYTDDFVADVAVVKADGVGMSAVSPVKIGEIIVITENVDGKEDEIYYETIESTIKDGIIVYTNEDRQSLIEYQSSTNIIIGFDNYSGPNGIVETNIYPVPVRSFVSFDLGTMDADADIILINALGKNVMTFENIGATGRYITDLSSLPTGIYFAQMLFGNGRVETKKFSIE